MLAERKAAVIAFLLAWAVAAPAYNLQVLTTNVLPLNGTESDGDEFPGAVVPFGMIQWSPDTTPSESGGYLYSAGQIIGFGLDHLSGAGCNYGGDFAFTPISSAVTNAPGTNIATARLAFASAFSHSTEIAAPGYYSVQFTNGIRTELTATLRTGFARLTYPAGQTPGLVINAGSGSAGVANAWIQFNPATQEVSGWTTQNGFCGSGDHPTVYFDAVFDHPFAAYGVWSGASLVPGATNASGAESGAYFTFNLPSGGVVLARTAISYVSVANAQANLQAESPAANFTAAGFTAMAAAASNSWNGYLNKIQVTGGTLADRQTFYTMMYHALQAPSVVGDVNGQYMGFDNVPHTAAGFTKYEFFSGWDIYRNECQFLAMMDPARASDMAQSLVQDAHECGAMPRWSVPNGDTGVMMGDPATPIIAGIYAFGGTNFNATAALAAMVNAAVNPAVVASNGIHERDAERDYLNLGFVPAAERGGYGPVSMTLEYGSADVALARFAQALGDTTNYLLAMNRAQNWRNHFNPASGFLQMRNSDFQWSPGFPTYGGSAYVEGSAYQYVWMVPYNVASLAEMMGGPQAALARLDNFFTELNAGTGSSTIYAYMGNEPCSEVPWIYDFLGEPYKASSIVRQVMTQLFSTAPGGLPGNDDLGQMASWYVLAALGLHPEIPGDNMLALNGPLFPQAVLHLTNGDVTITASGAADNAPYIQNLTVNGQPWNAPWIRYANIANGATLNFTMSAAANTNWGSAPAAAPPSYTDGMATPMAGNYVWGTGLETNDAIGLAWTNTADVGPYPAGGITNVGPINGSLSGPELGVRSENSQSGKNELMYSGLAQGGSPVCAYMKAFDLSAQPVTISPGMHLSYWVFPQSHTNNSLVAGHNSACVALDLVFADGTNLRDSGLADQHGVPLDPASQGGVLSLDTWDYVTVDLSPLAGKTVNRVDFGYSQPGSSGGYRGYVDDVALTTPVEWFTNNLALNQPAGADSEQAGNLATDANDGNQATWWSAADANTNHWWQVDLGGLCALTGDEVLWLTNGAVFDYTVAVSPDGNTWTTVINKTANISTAQDQPDVFMAAARWVRVTVTGVPAGASAAFSEFRAFGSRLTVPPAPTGLQAFAGYGLVGLSWAPVPGATGYILARSILHGAETPVATLAATNFADPGLTNGVTYYYTVVATNILGPSFGSSEVNATPVPPLPSSYAAAVMTNLPLAYWPLNETNGTSAIDWGGGHNGFYTGGVSLGQPGVPLLGFGPNRSALFDGASGYVDIPAGPFNITNALTITAWVNVPAMPHFSGVFGHGDSSWRLSVDGSGHPGAADDGGGDATSSTSIVGTGWHMLAYTYSGVPGYANNGTLYVDGTPKAHDTVNLPSGNAGDVWIGGSPDYGSDRLLPGSIAQVAIFTNAFTGAQMLALYNASLTSPPVSLKVVPTSDGNLALSWLQGTLLQSTNLSGPWTTNSSSTPCTVIPTNSSTFFRVLVK